MTSQQTNPPAPGAQSHPPYGYMRQKELMTLVPFSPATLWRKVKDGTFVKPTKLSTRITAWNRTQVFEWLKQQEGK